MNKKSLRPIVDELNKQGFNNKPERREIIQSILNATNQHVASILDLGGIVGMVAKNHGSESLDFTHVDLSDCLEATEVAEKYGEIINNSFSTLKVGKIIYERENSVLDIQNNVRMKKIGDFPANKNQLETQFYFEDESKNGVVGKINLWFLDSSPEQQISFEIRLEQDYNPHQANMDILALKNILENRNGGHLIQAKLENIILKYTDSLTGLYNGKYVEEQLTKPESEYSYIFIDISCFKEINDKNGQDIGDEAIKKVADFLQNSCRIDDKICRVGGDEFAILFKNGNENNIQQFISRLKKEQISITNNNEEVIDIELKYGYGIKNDEIQNYKSLSIIASEMLNKNKNKKGAAYRFKSMLLGYDEETRIYSLWELLQDPESLEYLLNAILTEPATEIFLESFLDVLGKFHREELGELHENTKKSLEKFIIQSKKIHAQAA